MNVEVAAAHDAGGTVVYTQDWHPESTPHFAKDGGIWPVHCVGGTWGAELFPDLIVHGPVVRKGTGGEDGYSGSRCATPSRVRRAPTQLQSLLPPEVRGWSSSAWPATTASRRPLWTDCGSGYEVAAPLALTRFVNLAPGDDDADDRRAARRRSHRQLTTC